MDFGTKKPAPGQPGAADTIKDATTASFKADVIEASKSVPVVIDFWASWCGPCKQLTPLIEKIIRSYSGKVRLVKINVDENQAVAAQLRVQSLPTVLAFRDGQPIDGFVGVQPESAIKAFVDRLVADDAELGARRDFESRRGIAGARRSSGCGRNLRYRSPGRRWRQVFFGVLLGEAC